MHVLLMCFLGWGACKAWDHLAGETALHRQWGFLIKAGLVLAAIGFVMFAPLHLSWDAGDGEPDVPVSAEE